MTRYINYVKPLLSLLTIDEFKELVSAEERLKSISILKEIRLII
ncbi:MAG: hypothetical protein ACP5I6_02690 [Caldisphaera sp.]|jgi:hypothetical protein|nr:hypothetical protein [Caldisphaera sp.]